MTSRRIVLANFGSFGDLHPYLGIARELQRLGHQPVIATVPHYREKVAAAGFEFAPVRFAEMTEQPDAAMMERILHLRTGPEYIIRKMVMPWLRTAFDESMAALDGASLLVSHPLAYGAQLAAEARGLPWVSTQLAPLGMVSAHDPPVIPFLPLLTRWHSAGPRLWRPFLSLARRGSRRWVRAVEDLRRDLGLLDTGNPLFEGGASPWGTLALFSPLLGRPQPDWPAKTTQTGFVFYDGEDAALPRALEQFLQAGEPPIVFTLGTAAVHNPGNFYRDSAAAAGRLGRRAVLLVGRDTAASLPNDLPDTVLVQDYAPFSLLLPRAAAVVHQGGVGTTAQAMRSGRPMLVVPWGVDQPDNAERVRRLGIARVATRKRYSADVAAHELGALLHERNYAERARTVGDAVELENGAAAACNMLLQLP